MTTFLERWYLAFFLAAMACMVMLMAGCEQQAAEQPEKKAGRFTTEFQKGEFMCPDLYLIHDTKTSNDVLYISYGSGAAAVKLTP